MKSLVAIVASLVATQAHALTLADCKRTTHPSHGGEIRHMDLGEGRVMWLDWWSLEGSAKGFSIVECGSGETLRFRTAEENMGRRSTFDRTDEAIEVLERHQSGARVFATFERIAADLEFIARDIAITNETEETCACAAAYPALRGEKTEFMLAG
ncbi:hypothetical protein QTO30_06845 [Yoonia sp. GPGPB17]|uniref:hypothetical protein n=1 Tax=Yoonia sp. GPGPB17 TaxID=3026147 RepID=UPI0030BE6FE8